jgi:hypothetical protein
MPIVTINDLKAKSAGKRGRKVGIATVNDGEYLQLGKGSESIASKMRKAEKQVRSKVILVAFEALLTRQKDKDGEFYDKRRGDTGKSLEEARTPEKMKQKQGRGEEADGNGNVYLELTPRQMAALPWANQDFNGATSEVNQAAVGKEQNEGTSGSHAAGANEEGGGEVKADVDCGGP